LPPVAFSNTTQFIHRPPAARDKKRASNRWLTPLEERKLRNSELKKERTILPPDVNNKEGLRKVWKFVEKGKH
jgi:hypothetical protein